jgi:predicted DNA-binding transcriptional regulator AlpA
MPNETAAVALSTALPPVETTAETTAPKSDKGADHLIDTIASGDLFDAEGGLPPTRAGPPKSFHLDKRAHDILAKIASGDLGALLGEMADPDQLLDTNAVAKLLAVSRQWVELGRHYHYGPPYLRLSPKRIRYRRRDLLAWLAERVHASTAEYGTTGGRPRREASDAVA